MMDVAPEPAQLALVPLFSTPVPTPTLAGDAMGAMAWWMSFATPAFLSTTPMAYYDVIELEPLPPHIKGIPNAIRDKFDELQENNEAKKVEGKVEKKDGKKVEGKIVEKNEGEGCGRRLKRMRAIMLRATRLKRMRARMLRARRLKRMRARRRSYLQTHGDTAAVRNCVGVPECSGLLLGKSEDSKRDAMRCKLRDARSPYAMVILTTSLLSCLFVSGSNRNCQASRSTQEVERSNANWRRKSTKH